MCVVLIHNELFKDMGLIWNVVMTNNGNRLCNILYMDDDYQIASRLMN